MDKLKEAKRMVDDIRIHAKIIERISQRFFTTIDSYIAETSHDSWEKIEEDATRETCEYLTGKSDTSCRDCAYFNAERECQDYMSLDLIRRAKALAGVGECDGN